MMELFDMGKYDFYVWTSVAVFIFALLVDFINLKAKNKHLKRMIQTKQIKANNLKPNTRREQL